MSLTTEQKLAGITSIELVRELKRRCPVAGFIGLEVTEPEKTMGLRGLTTTGLELERVEVGADALLGGAEGADVQQILNVSRTGLSAVMLGLSRAVPEYYVPYT